MKKKVSSDAERVTARSGATKERSPSGSTGSAQAERSGPEKMRSIPVRRMRWVGLSRASMLTSIPKMVCHNQSPTPPMPKTITPITAAS